MSGPGPGVVLAEGDALSRGALAEALRHDVGATVVAECSDARAVTVAVVRHRPALTLVDVDLGRPRGGLPVLTEIVARSSGSAALAIVDTESVEAVLAVLRTGAVGYVPRGGRLPEFVATVHAALRGESCVPRRVMRPLLAELLEQRRAADAVGGRWSRLSARERQVLELLGRGSDNAAIAAALVISPETVRTHVQNVLTKLEVHSRVEAAALAVAHGFVEDGAA